MSTIIYTDGACSGNPGPGGWGVVVLEDAQVCAENFGGEAVTTNNRMELTAVIEALTPYPDDHAVCVITDSKYVKDGINSWIHGWKRNGWRTSSKKPVKNQDLWQALDQQTSRLRLEWKWVKGHAGDVWNERADALARQGVASVS